MSSVPIMVISTACGGGFHGGLATSADRLICPVFLPAVGSAKLPSEMLFGDDPCARDPHRCGGGPESGSTRPCARSLPARPSFLSSARSSPSRLPQGS